MPLPTDNITTILLQSPTENNAIFVADSVTSIERALLRAAHNDHPTIRVRAVGTFSEQGFKPLEKEKDALIAVSAVLTVSTGLD